jgi:hypothetical protein
MSRLFGERVAAPIKLYWREPRNHVAVIFLFFGVVTPGYSRV